MLDDLGLDVPVAFPNTASFEGHHDLSIELERKADFQPLMQPIRADFTSPGFADSVSSHHYGVPGGGDDRFLYQPPSGLATKQPVRKMTLVTQRGELIRVRPGQGRWVTSADVVLTLAQWMIAQSALPDGAHNKHDVQSAFCMLDIGGVPVHCPVWLWKGLDQMPGYDGYWRILF